MSGGNVQDDEFSCLFNSFFDDLYRVAWRICGQSAVAEELCQEAFLRYYERKDRLPSGDEARYWLIRVVKNLALNYEKRRKREQEAFRVSAMQPRKEVTNEGEHSVLSQETREEVRRALLSLPYNLRVVLVLKEYTDYHYSDIARILKISEGNVKIRIFRARQQLLKQLHKGDVYVP